MEDERFVMMSTKGYQELVKSEDGKNIFWCTDINTELPIKMRSTGNASEPPRTLSQAFIDTSLKQGDKPALFVERGGKVFKWSWKQYCGDSFAFAKAMHVIGANERKAVNIMGHNAPEWPIAFVGGLLFNSIVSGVYPTNNAEACLYQAEHSEAEVIVVDSIEQLKKYEVNFHKLPNIKAVVVYALDKLPSDVKDKRYYVWKDFLNLGKDVKDEVIHDKIRRQKAGQCCCLIYTSGTTGNPKACMLSHDNLTWTILSAFNSMSTPQVPFNDDDRFVSYLPLSHIAGLLNDVISHICMGHQVYYARPDALQGSLVQTLQWAKPTYFLAVPRVWEKFEDKLKEIAASKGSLAQSISGWAKGHGYAKVVAQQKGQAPPLCYSVANFLILKRIKAALGLDECKGFVYGAAPIKQSTLEYFASLDIPILGAYGMSETTAATTMQNTSKFNLKSVGSIMQGGELKIDNPDEKGIGEICFRGRYVMMGYLKNEEATREVFDKLGYLHSGDLGKVDEKGFTFITGRIKELIITAGGENVAPVIIEDNFKDACPPCSNIMVIGENQKFLAAIITFKVDIDVAKGVVTRNLTPEAKQYFKNNLNVDVKTTEEAIANEKIQKFIQQCIEKANQKAVSRAAHVRKYKIIPEDFSLAGGELTPTLKLKRKVTEKKYQALVDEFYQEAKL